MAQRVRVVVGFTFIELFINFSSSYFDEKGLHMCNLAGFRLLANELMHLYGLPRYRAEFIVAKASGALTIADLERIIKKEPGLPLPTQAKLKAACLWFGRSNSGGSSLSNLFNINKCQGQLKLLNNEQIQNLISVTVSVSINDFFHNKEVNTTHMLDYIFPRERKIRSLIGGLETSMGTRVWEPLAKAFAQSNGFEVLNEKAFNERVPIIPDNLTQFISLWEKKKIENKELPLSSYFDELKIFIENKVNLDSLLYQRIPKGQGVDVILFKNGEFILFDIKTTQLNAGGGPKFLKNILDWYAYLALINIDVKAKCFLAFPFDPHGGNFWVKEGSKISPLLRDEEAYVADGFWDQLSGISGTTSIITSTFKELGEQNFGEQFSHHFI